MIKMNKKGFTLIEMLVVIAIIAVLVAIIIPVVGHSTTKAAAATNAANLRSAKAEATTNYLLTGTPTVANTPASKKVADVIDAGVAMTISAPNAETGEITVSYNGITIEQFADIAANGVTKAG